MKIQKPVAILLLTMIIGASRNLNAEEITKDIDQNSAKEILQVIAGDENSEDLKTLFNVENIEDLTPEQKNALTNILNKGVNTFKTDGVAWI